MVHPAEAFADKKNIILTSSSAPFQTIDGRPLVMLMGPNLYICNQNSLYTLQMYYILFVACMLAYV